MFIYVYKFPHIWGTVASAMITDELEYMRIEMKYINKYDKYPVLSSSVSVSDHVSLETYSTKLLHVIQGLYTAVGHLDVDDVTAVNVDDDNNSMLL